MTLYTSKWIEGQRTVLKAPRQIAAVGLCAAGVVLCLAQASPAGSSRAAPLQAVAAQQPSPPVAPSAAPQPQPATMNRTVVVLDAAHGGIDGGSRIGDSILEKDVTLSLALRLRALLTARGFTVVMTRENDAATVPGAAPTGLTLDDRAGVANHARAVACLLLHATAAGNGVHLYQSELEPVQGEPAMAPWLTAQAAWVTQSRRLELQMADALRRNGIPRIASAASVRPVDSLTCPALVVELAPEGDDESSVNDAGYQQRVAEALAGAIVAWPNQAQAPLRLPSASAVRAAARAAAAASADGTAMPGPTAVPTTGPATGVQP